MGIGTWPASRQRQGQPQRQPHGQQAIINVAVNLNLIPTKGMTLPFISYGGSSMLAMGLTLGLALALTRRRPGAYAHTEGLSKAGAYS